MSVHQFPQPIAPAIEDGRRPADAPDGALNLAGPLLTSREAATLLRRPSLKAFYQWCRRHHISPRRGLYVKAEIDLVLRRKRRAHVMAPASLANLRRRRKG